MVVLQEHLNRRNRMTLTERGVESQCPLFGRPQAEVLVQSESAERLNRFFLNHRERCRELTCDVLSTRMCPFQCVTCQLLSQRSGPRLTPLLRRVLALHVFGARSKHVLSHTPVRIDTGVLLEFWLHFLDCVLCMSVSAILTLVSSASLCRHLLPSICNSLLHRSVFPYLRLFPRSSIFYVLLLPLLLALRLPLLLQLLLQLLLWQIL